MDKGNVKKLFILDDNGEQTSWDGANRLTELTDQALKDFYEKGLDELRNIYYMESNTKGILYGFETTEEKKKKFRSEENHIDYLSNGKSNSGFIEISANVNCKDVETEVELIQNLPDFTVDIEKEVIEKIQKEKLRKELNSLSHDEHELMVNLFLSENCMTIREYAQKIGISKSAVDKRKKSIFKKIKENL